jgi:hypothetical protein
MVRGKRNSAVTEPSEMRELTLDELEIVGGGDVDMDDVMEPWHLPIPGRPSPDTSPRPGPANPHPHG